MPASLQPPPYAIRAAGDRLWRVRRIVQGENAEVLATLPRGFARLIYIDPPFNTGRKQERQRMRVRAADDGGRVGFGGRRYDVEHVDSPAYQDAFDDYVGFLLDRVEAALPCLTEDGSLYATRSDEARTLFRIRRVEDGWSGPENLTEQYGLTGTYPCLTEDGSLFVHLDYREAHYVKVALDRLLGRERFQNEIVWAYDFGGRPKRKWPAKHDTIFWYVLDPKRYVFCFEAMDRIPYMAPGLVGAEKAARGKTPTDVWWHTIVPTTGKEKTGYPTQKPLGVLERIIKVHTEPGDTVLDFFAGSGTTGEAAARNGRGFVLIDEHPDAIAIMSERLAQWEPDVEVREPQRGTSSTSKT